VQTTTFICLSFALLSSTSFGRGDNCNANVLPSLKSGYICFT
jgi:hypothetical protein